MFLFLTFPSRTDLDRDSLGLDVGTLLALSGDFEATLFRLCLCISISSDSVDSTISVSMISVDDLRLVASTLALSAVEGCTTDLARVDA